MLLLCARDEEVARLLRRRVVEFTAELPLTDRAVEFLAKREHGCRWAESLMAGVVPGDLKRQFAAVRAASSPGPCQGQALCGGHGPGWGRCVCPQEPSAHPDQAAADARSKEGGVRVPAR